MNTKEIYLDNCATTKPRSEVVDNMLEVLKTDYGNPSSLHRHGFKTEQKIREARENIAKFLRVSKEEIFFTSGGTESNNLAVQSIVEKKRKRNNHIITTKIEHSSILNIMKYYESQGIDVTYLDVDEKGIISLEELKMSLREDTMLISIMQVNNEIGSIEPVSEIKRILDEKNIDCHIHVDGIQAIGKIPLNIKEWGIDTFSMSGHKVYGPKGVGAIYIREGLKIDPIIYGGNQEFGLRSGTENVPGIVGFGKAMEILSTNFEEEYAYVKELKKYFIESIENKLSDIKINSPVDENGSPYVVNMSIKGIRGEILLHYLEDRNIYVSTGSACSKATKKSATLSAIGLDNNEIDSAIRICFSYSITKKDIDIFINELIDCVNDIRKITMR